MKKTLTSILLLTCLALVQVSAKPLQEIRESGRIKSSYLKPTKNSKKTSGTPKANLNDFKKLIAPIFKNNCVDCHGPKKAKGRFRIDELNPDLLQGPHINKWLEVYDVLSVSEMPPEDEPDYHLGDKERSLIINWLGDEMNKATQVRRNEGGHSSFRRLAKYEYNHALQDLLGLPYEYAERLPNETVSEDGFKNSSEHLHMTAMQFETYRELGLEALKKATISGERPKTILYNISMSDEMNDLIAKDRVPSKKKKKKKQIIFNKDDKDFYKQKINAHLLNRKSKDVIDYKTGTFTPLSASSSSSPEKSDIALVLKNQQEFVVNLGNQLPDTGIIRVRIRVGRSSQIENEFASLRLKFGAHTSNNANFTIMASKRDMPVTASLKNPEYLEFDIPLSEMPRNPFRKNKTDFPRRDELLTIQNISNVGPGKRADELLSLHIDHIQVLGPIYDQWPPESHKAIFFDSKNNQNEKIYCREVLKRFMARAWQRPIKSDELERYAQLFSKYRSEFPSFEATMLEVLATCLASPEFLYLTQKASSDNDNKINQLELANRLALFLWSSVADTELLKLAHYKKLNDPEILNQQIKRMLEDPRGQRFPKNFVNQWLGLHGINNIIIDKKEHRSYKPELAKAMLDEPVAFFDTMLKSNNSIIDFIHSDYLVINETLARHYRIKDVYGPDFRRVKIKEQDNRGGILTQAIVSTMNSNGRESNPLKRGIWLLEHMLNDPPPPPPPNVPEVDLTDPKILKMTLKEQIENHRNQAACRSCHAKIDPWGIAFENYDAIGAFRTQIKKKPVDATATLFNKQELAGMKGIKAYLLSERQDQFTRAFVHKMTTYALGRPLTFSDRSEVDKISIQLRKNGDRLGDLVQLIVNSHIFQSK